MLGIYHSFKYAPHFVFSNIYICVCVRVCVSHTLDDLYAMSEN